MYQPLPDRTSYQTRCPNLILNPLRLIQRRTRNQFRRYRNRNQYLQQAVVDEICRFSLFEAGL